MITQGKVIVNGVTATLGMRADPEKDQIAVDGRILGQPEKPVYIMLNKPRGYVTTASDDRGRKTVLDLVSNVGTRVYPVGRLDMDTEGLLLLTNDGDFANKIAHPSFNKRKTYIAQVEGKADEALTALSSPMEIDGYTISPARVKLLAASEKGGTLSITIHEGRNRQIRKMCQKAGLTVVALRRVSVGSLMLGDLKRGCWRRLSEEEIQELLQT